MTKLADMSIEYLSMQAEAGANALQIFDSWVGAVNADQYKQGIYPHMERIIKTVKSRYPHLPMAMNGVNTDHLISIWSHLPLDVIALIGVAPSLWLMNEVLTKQYKGISIRPIYSLMKKH